MAYSRFRKNSYSTDCLISAFMFFLFSIIGFYISINKSIDNNYSRNQNRIMAKVVSSERVHIGKTYSIRGSIEFDSLPDGAHHCLTSMDFGQNDLILPGVSIEIVPRNASCDDPIISFTSAIPGYVFEAIGLLIGLVFVKVAFDERLS